MRTGWPQDVAPHAEAPAQLTDAQQRRAFGSADANTPQYLDKHLTRPSAESYCSYLDKP